MNSTINEINSYPFERLRNLIDPKHIEGEINLSIGEPKHKANPQILDELNKRKNLFSHYPPMTMIPELKKSYTIIIVTHSMQQAARVSDKTAFFHLGNLIEEGDTSKIFTKPDNQKTNDYITGRFG